MNRRNLRWEERLIFWLDDCVRAVLPGDIIVQLGDSHMDEHLPIPTALLLLVMVGAALWAVGKVLWDMRKVLAKVVGALGWLLWNVWKIYREPMRIVWRFMTGRRDEDVR